MKATARKIVSLIMMVCIAFIGVFTMPVVSAKAEDGTWNLVTDVSTLAVNDQVVIAAKDANFAMSTKQNTNNRGQTAITKSGNTITPDDNVQILTLTEGTTSGTFAFYTGSGYLYAAGGTSTKNNYLKTQTTLNASGSWTIEITSAGVATVKTADTTVVKNWMRHNSSSSLFSCYSTGQNDICLYKFEVAAEAPSEIGDELNQVNAYMSLAYKYKATTTTETVAATTTTDTLDRALTGITATSYSGWSDKTSESDAVYAGQSAGGNSSIQLRTTNNNSGIVTTASGGNARKISVEWYSGNTSGRTIDIYGKNTAYTAATELYDANTQGTKLGSIKFGTSTELEITGDYAYIGIRSNSGALYLTKVQITWASGSETTEKEVTTFKASEFRLKCGVDAALADIEGITEYGIRVTAKGGNSKDYTTDANSWTMDLVNDIYYVVLNLGDIVNDKVKLTTEFTVVAYVKVDDTVYTSEQTKKYSVAGLIADYYDLGYDVEELYNNLVENDLV